MESPHNSQKQTCVYVCVFKFKPYTLVFVFFYLFALLKGRNDMSGWIWFKTKLN